MGFNTSLHFGGCRLPGSPLHPLMPFPCVRSVGPLPTLLLSGAWPQGLSLLGKGLPPLQGPPASILCSTAQPSHIFLT